MSREEEIEYYDNLIKTIEQSFASQNYDTTKLDNGHNEIIKTEKITLTLTTSKNEKSNILYFFEISNIKGDYIIIFFYFFFVKSILLLKKIIIKKLN